MDTWNYDIFNKKEHQTESPTLKKKKQLFIVTPLQILDSSKDNRNVQFYDSPMKTRIHFSNDYSKNSKIKVGYIYNKFIIFYSILIFFI